MLIYGRPSLKVEAVDGYNGQRISLVILIVGYLIIVMLEKEKEFMARLVLEQLMGHLVMLGLRIGRIGLMSWSASKFILGGV